MPEPNYAIFDGKYMDLPWWRRLWHTAFWLCSC